MLWRDVGLVREHGQQDSLTYMRSKPSFFYVKEGGVFESQGGEFCLWQVNQRKIKQNGLK